MNTALAKWNNDGRNFLERFVEHINEITDPRTAISFAKAIDDWMDSLAHCRTALRNVVKYEVQSKGITFTDNGSKRINCGEWNADLVKMQGKPTLERAREVCGGKNIEVPTRQVVSWELDLERLRDVLSHDEYESCRPEATWTLKTTQAK